MQRKKILVNVPIFFFMFVQVEQTLLVLMGRVLHLTIKLNLFSRLNLKTIEGKSRVKKSRYRTVPYGTAANE